VKANFAVFLLEARDGDARKLYDGHVAQPTVDGVAETIAFGPALAAAREPISHLAVIFHRLQKLGRPPPAAGRLPCGGHWAIRGYAP
jgi:hypothetical protein